MERVQSRPNFATVLAKVALSTVAISRSGSLGRWSSGPSAVVGRGARQSEGGSHFGGQSADSAGSQGGNNANSNCIHNRRRPGSGRARRKPNRPGGNVTGVYIFASALEAKRLGLLHEMVPHASLIAVLVNPTRQQFESQLSEVQEAARALGLRSIFREPASEHDFDKAFASFVERRVGALTVLADPFFFNRRKQLVALAARHALPAIYEWVEFTKAGGLMSYGADLGEGYRQAGRYVGRILKGERPADLPVVQSTKFDFAINLGTAKALRISVPPTLLARADEVIE